ncbi:uncharacterized protein AMSG_03722 [Thecamonas trahens ATCC 50062]|uniref:Uncharacterized protein n=1 Tax=Thecamonas trahens ATCC 50062 TaxID=461836 RepID=A0A0L0D7L0_THETB|nr:hypothetical protein AMSG_03722 [Thecamonas trahens ATCC 50062]KNC47288.1 hypothetical protein AMSG_03722 [Thecamonas trahens ATCC 50062]|eukprot:XP_013759629.1 hypothetical protein AMSG_03722 [Thecamonas trahens ATCC 50062]
MTDTRSEAESEASGHEALSLPSFEQWQASAGEHRRALNLPTGEYEVDELHAALYPETSTPFERALERYNTKRQASIAEAKRREEEEERRKAEEEAAKERRRAGPLDGLFVVQPIAIDSGCYNLSRAKERSRAGQPSARLAAARPPSRAPPRTVASRSASRSAARTPSRSAIRTPSRTALRTPSRAGGPRGAAASPSGSATAASSRGRRRLSSRKAAQGRGPSAASASPRRVSDTSRAFR